MRLSKGTRLGPYEVSTSLGAGGMGEVYRARDTRLGRDVALKIISGSGSADPERLRRFEHEARTAGALNHPNLLAVYDVGSENGSPYIVSELLEGEPLRERLQAGGLIVRKAVEIAIALAHGLAAAHEKGIVHRDLKPENVFLTRDGQVKILDFGLAKLRASADDSAGEQHKASTATETAPGTVIGTAAYMSPEQVRGFPVDARSDIFALGVLLYEALSGRRPFQGETTAETLTAVLKEDPPELGTLAPTVPAALDRIVKKCLEKRREDRFHSAHDLALALEAISSASGPGLSPHVAPGTGGRRMIGLGVATAAALLLVAAVAFLAREEAPDKPLPTFQRLTFRQGNVDRAWFSPDGQTVYYGAMWDGRPVEVFESRRDSPESRSLVPNATVLSISSRGEMALCLGFDGRKRTLARMPLAGGAPREVLEDVEWADWSPDGAQLAVVRRVGGRGRLEYPIGTVLFETGGFATHPRVSPRGDLVAFVDRPTSDTAGSLVVVDRTGKRVAVSSGWADVQGVAWSPGGREVWFTATKVGSNSAVHAITLSGKERVILRVPGKLQLQDISRDGRALLTEIHVRSGILGLFPGETRERDLSWLDFGMPGDLSADGRTLLIAETGEGGGAAYSVYLRKTDGSPAVRLGDSAGGRLSPDGKWTLGASPDQLVLLPTGAGEIRSLKFEGMTYQFGNAWFPDGRRIVFAAREPGHRVRSYVVDLDGGKPRAATPEGVTATVVSPDGRFLACSEALRGGELWLYPVDGGAPRAVPGGAAGRAIQWSQDGRFLYWAHTPDVPGRLNRVDLATGRNELWRELMPSDTAGVLGIPMIRVTPDGRYYAYAYVREVSDLYLVEGLR